MRSGETSKGVANIAWISLPKAIASSRAPIPLQRIANSSPPILAAEPRPFIALARRSATCLENLVSDRMAVNVVDGLEAVQIDQAQRERLAGFCCASYSLGEQALKAAPIGQPGQIVGERDRHRRLPRLLGDALLLGDHEP